MSDTDKIIGFAKGLKLNNEEFLEFLQNTEYSEKTLENYQQYMQKASYATSKFSATLKSVAANMAIMLAINTAIKIATKLWDNFNTTVAEVQSDLDETQSTISSLKTKIEELEKIDANAITQGQKDKLENLKEQLKVQEQLEEIEKRRLARETLGTGNFADYFDKDSYKNAYVGIMKDLTRYQGDIDGIAPLYEKRAEKTKRLSTLVDAGLETGTDVTELQESLRKAEEKQDKTRQDILKLQESLISSKADIQAWINTIEGFISDGSLVGEDLTEANNNLQELYGGLQYVNNELQRTNTLLYGGDDSWENVLAEKTMYSMKNLKDYGFSEDELKILSTLEFDKNASISELRDILDETQKEADENPVEPKVEFSKTQMIDTINSMADGFDVLDDIYADVLDGETFDFTKLDTSKFSEAFSEITPEYEKFIETISSSPTDIEACQGAFNDLVSAFIDSKGILSGLTEENKDLTISMLQNMGVANAEDVVLAHLNGTVQELALYKQFTAEKGYELANASYAEAAEFLNEAEASAVVKQELAQLALEKINVNENQISTSSDIDNIITLAEAARAGTAELAQLAKAKSVLSAVESAGTRERAGISEKAYQDALKTVEQINNGTFKYNYQKIDRSKFSVADYDIKPKYSGAKTTADAIEKANKSASDSAKDAAEEAKKAYSDWFDFMDVRVEKLNDAFTNLEKGMENVVGAFAKNQLVDAQLGIVDEEINNYTDALAMYKQQAQNVLSTIEDADLRDKIVNGAVELSQIQGENADVVKSAMEAYQNWSGKIQDCQIKLAELQKELENLELAKFTNIVDDFNDMFDLREDGKDLIEKQIDLIRESGNFVGKSYYQTLVEQSGKQLVLLEEEKAKLVSQMNESLSSGRVQVGSEAWISMLDHIQEVEESILDVKTNIEELDTELLNLHYEVFEKVQENFDNIGSELENLAGLFDDELEIKVSDGNGNWTDEALGQLGLLAQNLELSKYRVTEYGKEIEKLNQDYLDGKYTLLEYQEKLANLSQEQWNCLESAESLEDAIIDLNQTRIDEEIETIEDEIDAYEKLIDSKLKALDAEKDLHDYRKSIAEQSKSISDLEKQRAALENDNSQVATAKKKLLDAQIADEKSKLEEMEYEHSIEESKKSLEQQLQDYTDARNAEIEALRLSLENRELLISQSFENVKQNASTVGEQIALIAQEHGIVASNAIISPWAQGENAIASYGEVLSVNSSAFIGNIMGVEAQVLALQTQADNSSIALANMFATRADNLVGQLQASWYAEDNLNYATGILQSSLINTLERGYNIGGITSALGGIQSGLNGVADAANRAAQAIQNALGAQERRTSIEFGGGNGNKAYRVKDIYSGEVLGSFTDYNTAYDFWKKNKASSQIAMYAKGGVIKKDNNPLTPIAKSLGEDTVIVGKEGERVLTKKQNDLFETMVKNLEQNGNNFQWNIPNLVVPNNIPLLEKVNRPNITINYDSMLHVDNFTDAPHLIGAIESTSKKVTTKILNDINRDFRIHNR